MKKNKEDNNKKIEQPKYREIIKEKEKESKQNIIKYRMISPEQIQGNIWSKIFTIKTFKWSSKKSKRGCK